MLVLALVVRVAIQVAYGPAFLYSDSWLYIKLAFGLDSVGFSPERPSGYPLVIRILSLVGFQLGLVTALQHLAGLVTGVVVYALLLRLRVPRWLAAASAAVVLLDSYAMTLEHHIMAESLFTLALVSSAYLLLRRPPSAWMLAASGMLLAAAVSMRTVALVAVPFWLVYAAWRHRRLVPVAALALAVALPLLGYAKAYDSRTGYFAMGQSSGWFLYGRIGQIADCRDAKIPREARGLCNRNATDRRLGPVYHIWSTAGPARRNFGSLGQGKDPRRWEQANQVLSRFAKAIIRDRPLEYADVVVTDFLRYFEPGVSTGDTDRSSALDKGASDSTILLPEKPRIGPYVDERVYRVFIPEYRPEAGAPKGLLRAYQAVFHTPRFLLAACTLAGLITLALAVLGRGRLPIRYGPEIFLLLGAALAMLLASAALSHFVLRYLIPTVPLILSAGALAAVDLRAVWAAWRLRSRHPETDPAGDGRPEGAGASPQPLIRTGAR